MDKGQFGAPHGGTTMSMQTSMKKMLMVAVVFTYRYIMIHTNHLMGCV